MESSFKTYGYQSMPQPMFRHLQGTSNEVKEKILKEALGHGIEKAIKTASEVKARHKLRDYLQLQAGCSLGQKLKISFQMRRGM